ncbi:MAG: CsbD family protein [Actinomycetota bacterium]|nr:CsbD family protein [Actinomycetota bacterium]
MADWDRVEGTAKEAGGKLTGDESLEGEGKVQDTWGQAKDKADEAMDEGKERAGDLADEARDRM